MGAIKVLLTLDGSRTAEHSLVYLDAIKHLGDCTVELLCVANDSEDFQHQHSAEAIEREANLLSTYLREVSKDVTSHVGVEVTQKLVRGNPATCIVDEAASISPDLLVISTHGRTGPQRWRLGSVADKVIRGAGCNTLVIGPNAHEEEVWLDANAVEPFKSILVPLDGSELAERAIAVASQYAEHFQSTLHLVQVVRIPVQSSGLAGEEAYLPELLETLEKTAVDYVRKQAQNLAPRVEWSTDVMVGDAATQLEAYVKNHGIDLVVMTSHGRGGLSRSALGSVTDRLLANGAAPVSGREGRVVSFPAGTETQSGTVTYGTVLVPLDGSYIAAQALPHAVEVARRCNARVVLLHVIPQAVEDGASSRESQALRAQTEAYFAGLKRSLERYGVHVDWMIEDGMAAETIATVARHLDRPLIVLAQAGRTAALDTGDKRRVGNVAEQVARLWEGPVSLIEPVV